MGHPGPALSNWPLLLCCQALQCVPTDLTIVGLHVRQMSCIERFDVVLEKRMRNWLGGRGWWCSIITNQVQLDVAC